MTVRNINHQRVCVCVCVCTDQIKMQAKVPSPAGSEDLIPERTRAELPMAVLNTMQPPVCVCVFVFVFVHVCACAFMCGCV